MKHALWAAISGIWLCALCACGPVFNTEYSFSPPSSSGGRACTFQCDQVKTQCRQIEDLSQRDCERESRQRQRDCEDEIRYTKNRSPKWYECSADSCSADYDRCDDSYRSCYESCGGRVESRQVCVANCDQLQQPPPPSKKRSRGQ